MLHAGRLPTAAEPSSSVTSAALWQHMCGADCIRAFSGASASTSAAKDQEAPLPARAPAPAAPPPAGKAKKQKQQQAVAATGGDGAAHAQLQQLREELAQQYQASRMQQFYSRILSRELALKLDIAHVHQLPKLKRLDVAIQAKQVLGAAHVDKWQLLLHALGLELVSGRPAEFVYSKMKYYRKQNAVTGGVGRRKAGMRHVCPRVALWGGGGRWEGDAALSGTLLAAGVKAVPLATFATC